MQFGSAAKVLRKYNIGAPEIHSRGSLIHIAGCCSTYVLFGAPSMHFLLDKHKIGKNRIAKHTIPINPIKK